MKKSLISVVLIAVLVMSFIGTVEAAEKVTAKIGGSRMILRLSPGEDERRFITVVNDNSFTVQIDISKSGDLAEDLKLDDEQFSLSPGEEKKVYFTVEAPNEAGVSETSINVRYTPEEGNGVGISAKVIVVVSEDGDSEDDSQQTVDNDEDDGEGFSFNPSGSVVEDNSEGSGLSAKTILIASTSLLAVILVVLLIFTLRSGSKKGSRRPRE